MDHSGNVLAFIGDAVLTLQVRRHLVAKGITHTKKLQEESILYVSAKAQSLFMKRLLDLEILSDEEMGMYKRGRNAKSYSVAKNADVVSYRIATGFEALWGYLYESGQHERLDALWRLFKEMVEQQ